MAHVRLSLTEQEANAMAQVVTDYLAYWEGGGATKDNNIPALTRAAKKLGNARAKAQKYTYLPPRLPHE